MEYKKLYRSRTDRKLAGICGGLGAHFGMDPVIIRVIFIILTLFGGSGLLLYIIMALVVPDEPGDGYYEKKNDRREEQFEQFAEEI
ncbi:MAG TPA: PspC domain-containing protein, partial [Bacteroidales bacterium]|nr:PspC domain-containing protein [Bacteroidales bacterium]